MLLSWLAACGSDPPPPATEVALRPVTVALNWYPEPEFGGFYDAALRGLYRDAGVEVTLLPGGPGAPVLELLASGKADVALTGADDLLVRRARGLDAVAVFAGFQDSPVGLLVHVPGPTSWAEVRGPVAAEAGSPFQQFVWAKFGWEGKVELRPTTGGLGAFAQDTALAQQAYVTSEPCGAEALGLAVAFLPARDAGWNPYASLAAVRGADAGAPWVAAWVEATRQGWSHYLDDPTVANAEITRLNPDMGPDRIGCVTERQRPFVTGTAGVGALEGARFEAVAAALTSVGQPVEAAGAWRAP